ncbi:MAG: HAD family phosphatase [Oscillospiraceae bacterium]|nr:HAD family phosphatase [Oscillospiraceae bacterium]
MSRKVVFFDVDGTIMDERGFVPPSAIEAIRTACKNGVACIVNTGRPFTHIEPFIVDIGFDGYICSCGQYLFLDGKEIFRAPMDIAVCGAIVRKAIECNMDAYYEAEEGIRYRLCHEPDYIMRIYMERMIERGFETEHDPLEKGYFFDKFCVWAREDSDFEGFINLAEQYYTVIERGGGMYECILKGYSKETGVEMLRETLGAAKEDCYAIGDSANDLPMLMAVRHSIAMGNSPQALKDAVEYVTDELKADGLANALRHYKLI